MELTLKQQIRLARKEPVNNVTEEGCKFIGIAQRSGSRIYDVYQDKYGHFKWAVTVENRTFDGPCKNHTFSIFLKEYTIYPESAVQLFKQLAEKR